MRSILFGVSSVHVLKARWTPPPQPIMSYGTCWAWSAGSENCGLVQGQRVKYPTVSLYTVAKPQVVLRLEHEMSLKASREITEGDDRQAKRVSCARGQLQGDGCGEGEGARQAFT